MQTAVAVRPLEDYQLEVSFADGTSGIISLKQRLFGPMFQPLCEITFWLFAFFSG